MIYPHTNKPLTYHPYLSIYVVGKQQFSLIILQKLFSNKYYIIDNTFHYSSDHQYMGKVCSCACTPSISDIKKLSHSIPSTQKTNNHRHDVLKNILKEYQDKKITAVYLTYRVVSEAAHPTAHLLGIQHYEIILQINEVLYLLISFNEKGYEVKLYSDLKIMFKERGTKAKQQKKCNRQLKSLPIQCKEYSSLSWNCKDFALSVYNRA